MIIEYHKDHDNIVTLTMNMPGRATNVINEIFADALRDILDKLENETDFIGVILTSGKKTFMAGGDLEWLIQLDDPQTAFQAGQNVKGLFRRLEKIGKPVVAAINGSALGGGLELALCCHHRIAVNDQKLKLGFPEVSLGLIPGGGGIVRLTHLLGLPEALPFLMEGRQIDPATAQKAGIISDLAIDQTDLLARSKAWIMGKPEPYQPWDRPRFQIPGGSPTNPKVAQMLAIAPAMLKKKTRGHYPAPEAILNTAVEGAMVDFDTALRIESRYFAQIATGQIAKNMITAFWFQLNQINAGENRPAATPQTRTTKVGVLGAGMMGHGIAYVSAFAGKDVILKDVTREKAEAGKERIAAIINKRVAQRKMDEDQAITILGRIKCTADPADLRSCDLVIEAVFENRELKAAVTAEAEAEINPSAIFASNTSTLPITSLAANSKRPENFIGLHFFSPVHKMKLVEIICGQETSASTLARAFDYVRQINKVPIVVKDSRGFYTSRVFATYLKEGLALLSEGQHPQAIESAGLQAGMPVGPLALADEVSLSLIAHIEAQTREDYVAEGKELPTHPGDWVLEKMTDEFKRLGKAAGAGFYEYPAGGAKYLWPELITIFSPNENELSQEEMMERLMFVQALETTRCFAEGVVTTVADANIGSIFGWGFAPFKGGTLQFINDFGIERFYNRCQELAERNGDRFSPPHLLAELVQTNKVF